ncbi:hypothetical protein PLESTB_000955300 [Pleodorina starrii]|uniref:Uncharacterized protein n=1 Tax=Pleodorina starrii TaxID=330485 RepID=A0A9W6FBB0_9CHLO|nr:hypothetical protein PLESTM_001143300 [Pleodorina starrii]GLC77800.1 hypothetical protein PLESTB_000955300 [Pleodorina starrii]GLC77884.1 hypothetical protein PLESTF_001067900 [Pleodorina starrii]
MALQVNLTLSKTYFLPGEVVHVCVQIFNETENVLHETGPASTEPVVLHIKELSFQANGSERTDSNFVHRLHHPEVLPDVTDSRKRVRSIFSTESAVLVSDKILAPHVVQTFSLRFRLPLVLPPTFRGSAVRFFYMIHVKAVYEVQRGKLDAVVYETTASTNLTVWPSTSVPVGIPLSAASSLDRRASSSDHSICGLGTGPGGLAGSDNPSLLNERKGKGVDAGAAGRKAEEGHFHLSGAGGGGLPASAVAGMPLHATPLGPAAGNAYGGSGSAGVDDGDVPMCDYGLGRKCRIRRQEIGGGDVSNQLFGCSSRVADGPAQKTAAGCALIPRGVIPFGVNRPFDASFPAHSLLATDTDSDAENGQGCQPSSSNGLSDLPDVSSSACLTPAQPPPHVQRQLSSGAGGLTAFTRQPSRRSSLFGKVYMLNVGDQPLLRLLLHAPLEAPLQPGATFGGVLDFRQLQAAGPTSRWPGQTGTDRLPTTCYNATALLETEEVLSPECRPQSKWDGGTTTSGSPYIIRRLHAEYNELTNDTALTSFVITLPMTATPSFRTPMVSLRWVLRFELTVGPRMNFMSADKRVHPLRPPLEQLIWTLPLHLRSPIATPR